MASGVYTYEVFGFINTKTNRYLVIWYNIIWKYIWHLGIIGFLEGGVVRSGESLALVYGQLTWTKENISEFVKWKEKHKFFGCSSFHRAQVSVIRGKTERIFTRVHAGTTALCQPRVSGPVGWRHVEHPVTVYWVWGRGFVSSRTGQSRVFGRFGEGV